MINSLSTGVNNSKITEKNICSDCSAQKKKESLIFCISTSYKSPAPNPNSNTTAPTPHHYPITPPPCFTTPHLDSGFRCIPQGPMPLNCSIHIPSPPCVTCTLHMCEKNSQPSKCYSRLCSDF